ncbi:hypothetical protein [Helicobacter macacae]|nr:hypothetical protein [Helicobacter macacae]
MATPSLQELDCHEYANANARLTSKPCNDDRAIICANVAMVA